MHVCNHHHHQQDNSYVRKQNPVAFRQGRIKARSEQRRQLIARRRLERRMAKQLDGVMRRWLNNIIVIYRESAFYDPNVARFNLEQELIPTLLDNYKRIFRVSFGLAEERFSLAQKSAYTRYEDRNESFLFGRNAEIDAYIEAYFGQRNLVLAGISRNLSMKIYSVVNQTILDGGSLRDVANAIRTTGYPFAARRVALIARTETANAANTATNAYYQQASADFGITMKKMWLSTGDARTRRAHSQAGIDYGQSNPIPMNEPFIVNGEPLMYAGDPAGSAANVVNCRCVVLYADQDDSFF